MVVLMWLTGSLIFQNGQGEKDYCALQSLYLCYHTSMYSICIPLFTFVCCQHNTCKQSRHQNSVWAHLYCFHHEGINKLKNRVHLDFFTDWFILYLGGMDVMIHSATVSYFSIFCVKCAEQVRISCTFVR